MQAILAALWAAVLLGALSTAGDFVWAHWRVPHRIVTGLIHGAAICLAIGAVIGVREHRPLAGTAAGPVIGLLAAAAFYALAPWLRWGAMFPAWMFFWICFAWLQGYLRGSRVGLDAAVRGVAAAVLSGLAFYTISGIWTRPSPGGPDYVRNLWSWTFAFLPGFAALFWSAPRTRNR